MARAGVTDRKQMGFFVFRTVVGILSADPTPRSGARFSIHRTIGQQLAPGEAVSIPGGRRSVR
jgi:hypothetical protein